MNFRIPLMKHAFLEEAETRRALADFVLTAERLSMDKECFAFEREFAAVQGRDDAILFNSGGSANLALLQALKNLGKLGDGSRVGFSAVTWSTNVMPILQLGMVPVPIDVEPDRLNVTSTTLAQTIGDLKIDAFFGTNVLGFLGDLDQTASLLDAHGTIFLEDNCESLGSELASGKAGNFGLASTCSFYISHHMSTIEGGIVCTDDEALGEMLRIVRSNGWSRNLAPEKQASLRHEHGVADDFLNAYAFYDLGYNLRPTEITGFLGRRQLQWLDETIAQRVENFRYVMDAVACNDEFVPLKRDSQKVLSSFALPFLCTKPEFRSRYVSRLGDAGIECRPIIAGNLVRQPFYSKYVAASPDLPGADFVHQTGFYVGNYPELTQEDLETIVGCLREW